MVDAKDQLVKDPVCGMVKPKGQMKAKFEFGGRMYYFCTEGDKKLFEAYPKHWIPKKVVSLSD